MKEQTTSKPRQRLALLSAIVLPLVLALAHSTQAEDSGRTERADKREASKSAFCTTEAEFKAIITHDVTYLARRYEKREVVFHSFKVGAPKSYQNFQEGYRTVTNAAYPVLTDFDVITTGDSMGTDRVYRARYKQSLFMCYPLTSKETCVCFAEKNSIPVREEITGAR